MEGGGGVGRLLDGKATRPCPEAGQSRQAHPRKGLTLPLLSPPVRVLPTGPGPWEGSRVLRAGWVTWTPSD